MIAPLFGKVALVLGGADGVAAAISRRLAGDGASVAMVYKSRTTRAIKPQKMRSNTLSIQADITNSALLFDVFCKVDGWFGGFDILIYDMGMTLANRQAEDNLEEIYVENVKAFFIAMRIVAQRMQENGRVIAIDSYIAPRSSRSCALRYDCERSALDRLIRFSALELAPRFITVNMIQSSASRIAGRGLAGDGPRLNFRDDWGGVSGFKTFTSLATLLIGPEMQNISGETLTVDENLTGLLVSLVKRPKLGNQNSEQRNEQWI